MPCANSDKKLARSQADRQLFELTANDLKRHLTYGVEHLRHYVLQGGEQKRRQVRTWLDRGEIMMAADLKRDTALRESIILASATTVADGKAALKELRQLQLKRYLQALDAAAYRDRHGPAHEGRRREPIASLPERLEGHAAACPQRVQRVGRGFVQTRRWRIIVCEPERSIV